MKKSNLIEKRKKLARSDAKAITFSKSKRFKTSEKGEIEASKSKVLVKKVKKVATDNFPLRKDGSTWHVQVKPRLVANRIISVGDSKTALALTKLLDPQNCITKVINSAIRVYTGTFKGVPVSIIATGMG